MKKMDTDTVRKTRRGIIVVVRKLRQRRRGFEFG
jgi:hypothetical protein